MVWLTPAHRSACSPDPPPSAAAFSTGSSCASIRATARGTGHFERAMQQRNRLLDDGVRDNARFEGLELVMAETGIAIAAARAEAVAGLADHRRGATRARSRFAVPWPQARARGHAGSGSRTHGRRSRSRIAIAAILRGARERDRAAGPHARRAAPLRPRRRRTVDQGDAGAAVLHGRAEGAADGARPGACRARRAAPRRGRADPAARRDRRRISTRRAGPRCSTEILRAGVAGLDDGNRSCRPSRRSPERAQFARVDDGRGRPRAA